MPSSKGSSEPRDWTQVSHAAGGFFTVWATREAQAQHTLLKRLSFSRCVRLIKETHAQDVCVSEIAG